MDRRTKEYRDQQAGEIAPVRRRSQTENVVAEAAAPTPQAAAQAAPEPTEAVPAKFRRPRAAVGGMRLKLTAPSRPGFVRRFVKNDPTRILEMQEMGYDFAEANTNTDSLGTRITRHAGKGENGQPEQLVLMETPESEYAKGVIEKEEQRQPFEQAIRAGRPTSGELTDPYEPRYDRSSLTHTGR